jgi:tRNA G10  N-methylase Trm11
MYLFILGKNRELSLAELLALYPTAEIKSIGHDYVSLKLNKKFFQKDLDRLGGVIKVARLITSVNFKALEPALHKTIQDRYQNKKFNYAVSVYDYSQGNLRNILAGLKKLLKKSNIRSRFANQNFKNLSVAQYKGLRNKNGVEFIVCKGKAMLLAEVVAVQNIDAYSERDFNKPFRSMKVGMLPPKLAQILINLTGVQKGIIWDPFCGGGVLLMEALLMGHDVIGSDIDPKTLEGAKKNVEWLGSDSKADFFVHDATSLFEGKTANAIAMEGYLGPLQTRKSTQQHLKSLLSELDTLYVGFFEALKVMRFKGPIVIAMPFFRVRSGLDVLLEDTVKKIEALGFALTVLLPKSLSRHDITVLKYARPDQIVGRAIYRFQAQ